MRATHMLDTIYPKIHFGRGPYVNIRKRSVRLYKGQLCVSAQGALYSVSPVGPRTCKCDLTTPPLVNFGSRKQARAQVQSVAPVATLARLGIIRAPKPIKTRKKSNARIDALEAQINTLSERLASYTPQATS
jgi:hypothetical protein